MHAAWAPDEEEATPGQGEAEDRLQQHKHQARICVERACVTVVRIDAHAPTRTRSPVF